jgi:hypothetical protein
LIDYDTFADGALADLVIERERKDWQKYQDARARKSGRAVEFTPSHSQKVIPGGPTCPACGGGVVLTGNMLLCRSRACRYQGASNFVPTDRQNGRMVEKEST